uniref:Aspartate dehydrogenase domain-containing protein n=1 Tax=Romanomermis culicivorax TaxID=13658 RepID=A0A915K916_ROMCU
MVGMLFFPQEKVLLAIKYLASGAFMQICGDSHSSHKSTVLSCTLAATIGSPTALADEKTLNLIKESALAFKKTVYVPSGAFWGAEDVKKMADNGKLKELTITMQKHPSAFRLETPLKEMNESFDGISKVLYEGPVKYLCGLAPNNVNTMAVACIAGHNLGFDKVVGRLISDKRLSSWHIVEAELKGDNGFCVKVTRKNPALSGAVSGLATYDSFWSSLKSNLKFYS